MVISSEEITPSAGASMWARWLGWGTIALLVCYLINTVLIVGFGLNGVNSIFADFGVESAICLISYLGLILLSATYASKHRYSSFRTEALKLHSFNIYFLRACFFSVLLVGLVDFSLAFCRAIDILDIFFGDNQVKAFGRANFVGTWIHLPLIAMSFIIAMFSRTLGFNWLTVLIVFAELFIVLSRYVFSYEQSFMADLVRYWYAALFLFASAYTLFEEGHVRVDVIYAGLSDRAKALVNAWGSYLLGVSTASTIIFIGFNGKASIINSPLLVFEITNQGSMGMFIKYQMALFLGLFGITMLIQFVSQFFESIADLRGEAGKRDTSVEMAH
jgi:TRAP-type mannitol/chloroaromatic compound transport system permease small subunit